MPVASRLNRATPADGALVNPPVAWSPSDLGWNNVVWPRAGVFSLDLFVEGYDGQLWVGAISDDSWVLEMQVYDHNGTAILYGPVAVSGFAGRSGGQVDYYFVLLPLRAFAQRIRFRGRGLLAPTANSSAVVHGTAVR